MVNPGSISLNPSGGRGLFTTGASTGTPRKPTEQAQATPQSNVVQSQTVRATGTGPYDNAYRQDLATYAGGLASRPGGNLSFNPTGNMFGNPSGGGNAPVLGGPTDLLSAALGGQAITPTQPQSPQPAQPQTGAQNSQQPYWQFWLNGYNNLGANLRGSNTY